MIRCWTVNPEVRPTFRQLCEDLTTMAKEPHRFIVLKNETQQAFNLPTSSNVDYLQDLITETEHDDFEITEAEDYLLPDLSAHYTKFPKGSSLLKKNRKNSWEQCVFYDKTHISRLEKNNLDSIETESTTLASGCIFPSYQRESIVLQSEEKNKNYLTNVNKSNNSFFTPFENGIQKSKAWLSFNDIYHQATVESKTVQMERRKRRRSNSITLSKLFTSKEKLRINSTTSSERYCTDPTQAYVTQSYLNNKKNFNDFGYLTPSQKSRFQPDENVSFINLDSSLSSKNKNKKLQC